MMARSRSSPIRMSPDGAHGAVEQPAAGDVHEPLAVDAGAGLLGDLETDHGPLPEGSSQLGTSAGPPGPAALGPPHARIDGLRSPLQVDRRCQDARDRPLDVLAHGEWGRVDVYDATRWHGDLPETEVRLPLRPRPRLIVSHDAGWYGWCARETAISTSGIGRSWHTWSNGRDLLRRHGIGPSRVELTTAFFLQFPSRSSAVASNTSKTARASVRAGQADRVAR